GGRRPRPALRRRVSDQVLQGNYGLPRAETRALHGTVRQGSLAAPVEERRFQLEAALPHLGDGSGSKGGVDSYPSEPRTQRTRGVSGSGERSLTPRLRCVRGSDSQRIWDSPCHVTERMLRRRT